MKTSHVSTGNQTKNFDCVASAGIVLCLLMLLPNLAFAQLISSSASSTLTTFMSSALNLTWTICVFVGVIACIFGAIKFLHEGQAWAEVSKFFIFGAIVILAPSLIIGAVKFAQGNTALPTFGS